MDDVNALENVQHDHDSLALQSPDLPQPESNVPNYNVLKSQLEEASLLVDDIVLKKYLTKLSDLEAIPLDDSLKNIEDIQLFKITEMVYQKKEYSIYKLASVFNSVQNLNCGVFIIVDSDGKKTDFYMGVRSLDDNRTTSSLKETLRNSLHGQFPGVKTKNYDETEIVSLLNNISSQNIAAVSCVAQNKDGDFKDDESFIQGLEKLALAMQGRRYTAVILAKSTPSDQLNETRRSYENIYTQLSPFANMQLSYGTNTALSISDAFSKGTTVGTSHSISHSTQKGKSSSYGKSTSVSKDNFLSRLQGAMGFTLSAVGVGISTSAILGSGGVLTPLAAKALLVSTAAAAASAAAALSKKTTTEATSENHTESESETDGETNTNSKGSSENQTSTRGVNTGTSDNMQLTMQNKTLINTLERIDLQLKRIDECESLGMWECASYFLSDTQETAEMAAGTYKALMKGENSGVETSAINFWGKSKEKELPILREYITHLLHPMFIYKSDSLSAPVTASSLISGNELAIQMSLPKKSVCGFPVFERADFGKEVVRHSQKDGSNDFAIGSIFNTGDKDEINNSDKSGETLVKLDRDSLTMHTFVTGSTGSGKSNTVYEIMSQLDHQYNIPFLVIEPAKGEYKNIFGQFPNVSVYGTNPKKTKMLRINPFRFPADIHVLEHLDRLVEIFNVCWPMYAAMPAILKESMENAYISVGWDIISSENAKGDVFPNFNDLLREIESVIDESKYSVDSKGDYSGALCTRVRSLTNGLNGMIFSNNDLSDEDLFDKKVIVDLSRVGSTETKSLIMGLLVMRLNEYRMSSDKINSPLSHITVLEEAHNLLKRTSTEQSSESSNLLGKSVELLANSIAEMRTYGEGFIIVDQSPGLLDMSAIRNTNTKIILRLPEQSDRELVGRSAGLNDEQIDEIAKLERGVAAVYQNDWVEPVLVKINKCKIEEKIYSNFDSAENYVTANIAEIKRQLIYLLIQGRVNEKLSFKIEEIEKHINFISLSTKDKEFIKTQLSEYKIEGKLSIWEDENFEALSLVITDLLGVRNKVEGIIMTVNNNSELTNKVFGIIENSIKGVSDETALAICQSLMKDFSVVENEREHRELIFKHWFVYVTERGVI